LRRRQDVGQSRRHLLMEAGALALLQLPRREATSTCAAGASGRRHGRAAGAPACAAHHLPCEQPTCKLGITRLHCSSSVPLWAAWAPQAWEKPAIFGLVALPDCRVSVLYDDRGGQKGPGRQTAAPRRVDQFFRNAQLGQRVSRNMY
jgi:hypothetical protein